MAASHRIATAVSCHAWSADRSMLAICPNNSELWIFANCADKDPAKWERKWVLKKHGMLISGVDWHAETNRIVTCSHDRDAFVWNFVPASDSWEPVFVNLRIKNSAIDVRWSPNGKKLAVSSAAREVIICWYDSVNNWWAGYKCRRLKSTAIAVAWHPNSQLLATVGTEWKCKVMCAWVKEVDGDVKDGAQFGQETMLAQCAESDATKRPWMAEFDPGRAWVEDCAWSPSGRQLAFVAHDSTMHVATWAGAPGEPCTLRSYKLPSLPAMRVMFLSDDALVTGGHSCNPEVWTRTGSDKSWRYIGSCDRKDRPTSAGGTTSGGGEGGHSKAVSSVAAARAMFASKVSKGITTSAQGAGSASTSTTAAAGASPAADSGAETPSTAAAVSAVSSSLDRSWQKHQSAITYMKPYGVTASGSTYSFTTTASDGKIITWDLKRLGLPDLDIAAVGLM